MKEKENKDGSVELWGHTFNKNKLGLDEDQVVSFVTNLISERDKLSERQGHLTYLAELAEKTVAEADNIANRIREEAKNKAEAEATEIRAEAEQQAQQIIEEKTAEAKDAAEKEIEAMKANAEKLSAELIKKNAEKLQSNLNSRVKEMCKDVLAQTESFRNEVASFEADMDGKLAEIIEGYEKLNVNIEDDKSKDVDSPTQNNNENVAEVQVEESPETDEAKEQQPVSRKDWYANDDEEAVVLEFLPPRDQDEIESIQVYLDSLPEVSVTEIKVLVDKTVIKVQADKQLNLFETIEALPIVQQVTEIEEDGQTKLQILLDLVSSIDLSRDTLKRDFSSILSKKK